MMILRSGVPASRRSSRSLPARQRRRAAHPRPPRRREGDTSSCRRPSRASRRPISRCGTYSTVSRSVHARATSLVFAPWVSISGSHSSSRQTGSTTRRPSRSSLQPSRPITCRRASSPPPPGRPAGDPAARTTARAQGDSGQARHARRGAARRSAAPGAAAARAPIGGRRAVRQAGARRRERTAARRGDDGLLGEPFLRLRRQGTDAALPRGLRPRRHSPARARQVPRPARRRREESGDAVLPRQFQSTADSMHTPLAGARDASRAPAARAAGAPRPAA